MRQLLVNELFAGIGAQERALCNLEIPHKIVGISEIDKWCVKSYTAIHGDIYNYGDISQIEALKKADLWTYSFPCTDISNAGKMLGISWDTRSGLLLQVGRLLNESLKREELPEYLVMENVSNLLSHKFIEDFNRWLEFLDCLRYDNSYAVLNACDFGLPQNRNRVFLVSRLKSCGGLDNFVMPQGSSLQKSVIDFLDPIRERERERPQLIEIVDKQLFVKQATKAGKIELKYPGVCDLSYPTSTTRRGRVQRGGDVCPTLTASSQELYYFESPDCFRKLSVLENWRLMGFKDEDYYKAKAVGVGENQLKKQAGNSIAVPVMEAVFKELLKSS